MITCSCIVQAGQIPSDKQERIKANLNAFAEREFGEPVEINWMEIPARSGFTANEPSTSSIVSMQAPRPVPQVDREPLLRELCGIWTQETNCTLNEIVGVISDPVAE